MFFAMIAWTLVGSTTYFFLCKRFKTESEILENFGACLIGPLMLPVAAIIIRVSKKWGM